MKSSFSSMTLAIGVCLTALGVAGPAMADKPGWAASGKGVQEGQHADGRTKDGRVRETMPVQKDGPWDGRDPVSPGDQRSSAEPRRHFEPQHQLLVRDYYGDPIRGRRCPPGLAKKNNRCMPPGIARQWRVGMPLPRHVIYYNVPQPLVLQIGSPPSGYRYVRVAGDILMIAIGTGLVVDAIQDLGRN